MSTLPSFFVSETEVMVEGAFDSAMIAGDRWIYVSDWWRIPGKGKRRNNPSRDLVGCLLGEADNARFHKLNIPLNKNQFKICIVSTHPNVVYVAVEYCIYRVEHEPPIASTPVQRTQLMHTSAWNESCALRDMRHEAIVGGGPAYMDGNRYEAKFGHIHDLVANLEGTGLYMTEFSDGQQRIRRIDLRDDEYNTTTEIVAPIVKHQSNSLSVNLVVMDQASPPSDSVYYATLMYGERDVPTLVRVEGPVGENGRRIAREIKLDRTTVPDGCLKQSLSCTPSGMLITINAATKSLVAIDPKTGKGEPLGGMSILECKSRWKIASYCDAKEPFMWFCTPNGPLYRSSLPTDLWKHAHSKEWTSAEVGEWIRTFGIAYETIASIFMAEGIDGSMLHHEIQKEWLPKFVPDSAQRAFIASQISKLL
jgi:hypothetical protein